MIGMSTQSMVELISVLDTGAGSSFIRKDALSEEVQAVIKPLGNEVRVRDANKRQLRLAGTVDLRVTIGNRDQLVTFYVAEQLATPVILGCDFCDEHIEAIKPRRRVVELVDGTTVPIIRTNKHRTTTFTIQPAHVRTRSRRAASSKVVLHKTMELPAHSQTWVSVTSKKAGLTLIESHDRLYQNWLCLAATGVAQVQPGKPFDILVANFSEEPVTLSKGLRVATATVHPKRLRESKISHGEMLGVFTDEEILSLNLETTKYQKRGDLNAKDPDQIDRHLADAREAHMDADEKPVTADDLDLSDVDAKHHAAIRKMMRKHEDMWSGKLGNITVTEHTIDLVPGARPARSAPFRAGPKERELQAFELNKQLSAGLVEPSQSAWAAPVLFVPKKDGRLRFCVDYRRLNAVTIQDSYPLPRIDDCIDTLGEAVIFSTLDAYSGYHQLAIAKKDRHKTAFVTHHGQFQYVRMPFGLSTAPASFQRALDMILTQFKWKTCLVYLDDVIIFSNSVEEHIKHVDEILTALGQAGVTLKIAKCRFFTKKVEYLGHFIRPGTLEADTANVKCLQDAVPPTTKTEVRSFLGMANYYRRFIENFSKKAAPLNDLLQKNAPDKFDLNDAQQEAFTTLIDEILSPQILALPKKDLPYSVDTDASDYGIGCALFQTDEEGIRRPIGFWSRTLNPAEKNYSATERECLAAVFAVKTLRPYLLYEKFDLHTDHAALQWLFKVDDPSGRLMRWRLRLAEFNYDICYKKGASNHHADAMSRLATLSPANTESEDDEPLLWIEDAIDGPIPSKLRFKLSTSDHLCLDTDEEDLGDIADANADETYATLPEPTHDDPIFSPVTAEEMITAQWSDAFCVAIRQDLMASTRGPFFTDDDDVVCRKSPFGSQIVVPAALRAKVLHIYHYSRMAGHPGGKKMYHMIRRHFYWPSLSVDSYAIARKCPSCAKNRIKLRRNTSKLQLFPPEGPLDSVAIDIFGEIHKTDRGNQYLLMICDRFTKLTKSVPLKGVSAAEVATAFVNEWVFNYGPPKSLLADNGKCFTSKFFQSVCKILNVENQFTTTYHPQANGQVERFNRTLKAAIKAYLEEHPNDWDLYTRALTYAYNCQPHSATAIAPFELVLARPPPSLAYNTQPRFAADNPKDFGTRWRAWLKKALVEAKSKLDASQARYKKNFDDRLRRQKENIKMDDSVFLRVERRSEKDVRHKLAAVADGPFKVIEVDTKTVVIEKPDKTVERVSRDRVVLAPERRSSEQIKTTLQSADANLQDSDLPASDKDNLKELDPPMVNPRKKVSFKTPIQWNIPDAPHELDSSDINDGDLADSNQDTQAQQTTSVDGETHTEDETTLTPKPPKINSNTPVDTEPCQADSIAHTNIDNENDTRLDKTVKPTQNATATRRSSRARQPNSRYQDSANESDLETETEDVIQRHSAEDVVQPNTTEQDDIEVESFPIDRIVAHKQNQDGTHPTARRGDILYKVRWHDYGPQDDTWEPISHLPRNKVVSYHKLKRLPLPPNIGDAQLG